LAQNDHALEQARLDLTQRDHALEHERAHSQEAQAENVELVAQLAVGNDRQNENRDALLILREETQQEIGDLRRLIDQHAHMECVVCLTSYVELNQIGNYFETLNSCLTFYFYLKCFSYK
jgi:Rad3-related DNA helicase